MANNIKGITVEIGGNTENLNSALKSVNKTAGDLQSELKQVQKQLKFDPTSTELLSQKGAILKESISTTEDKLKQLKSVQGDVEQQFKNGDLGEEKYRAFQRELEKTKSQLQGLKKEQAEFGNTAGATLEAAGKKIKASGESITKVGEGVTKNVTAPIAAVGTASLAAFSEVDSSMDTVAEKTGATGKTLEGLQGVAENIATTIPTSFENAGNAVGEVNTRFGLTGQALQNVSTDFIKFSEINKTDVTESVQGVQEAMSAFGVKTADTQNVLGLLTSVSQKTGVSVSDLTNDLSSNVATFQEAHLSIGQATTLLGNFEKAGLDSGTMMSGLKKAASTYSKEGKSMSQGLGDLIKRLQSSKTEAGAAADAYKIFGARGGLAFVNAAKSGKISLSGLSSGLTQYGTTVSKTFEATEDPIDKSKVTLNQLKAALAQIGSALGTTLAPILQAIANKLKDFTNWWKALSPQTQQTIIKIALIAAAVGPLIIVIGKLKEGLGGITDGIGFLIKHPILAIILAVAAAAILVITHWTQVKTFFIGLWNTIKSLFGNIGNWFKSVFSAGADGVKSAWSGITGFFSGVLNGIKGLFAGIGNWFKSVFTAGADGAKSAWSGITGFFSGIWSGIRTAAMAIVTPFVRGILSIWNSMKTGIQNIMNGLKNILGGIWTAIKNVVMLPVILICDLITGNFGKMGSDVSHIFTNVKNALTQIWAGIRQVFFGAVQAIGGFLALEWHSIITIATSVWNAFSSFMSGLWDGICSTAVNAWNGLVGFFSALPDRIGGIMNSIGSWVQNVWNGLVSFLSGLPARIGGIMDSIGGWIRDVWNGLVGFIGSIPGRFASGLSGIGNAVREAFSDAINFIKDLPSEALQWGRDIINGIVNGIKSAAHHVRDAVSGVAQNIRSFLHFSVPDEGPLTDYESWMPDFMKGLANGIRSSTAPVFNAAKGVASGIAASIRVPQTITSGMQLRTALAAAGGYSSGSNGSMSGDRISRSPIPGLTVIFKGNSFGGKEVAKTDVDKISNAIALKVQAQK